MSKLSPSPIDRLIASLPICSPREPVHTPEQRLAWALMVCGLDFHQVFARTPEGRFRRGRHTLLREHVLFLCRQPNKNGLCPSFPELAAAIGIESHSTLVEAVHRATARLQLTGRIAELEPRREGELLKANRLVVLGGAA